MPSTTHIEIPVFGSLTLREGRYVIIDGVAFRLDRIQQAGRITMTPARGVLVADKNFHAAASPAAQPDPTEHGSDCERVRTPRPHRAHAA